MDFDALLLSRMQFAFTVAFHILFPAFTIGLAAFLAVLEGLWLWTRRDVFQTLYLFWVKIFALSFGMGVVSGVVLSYQFGTNWSEFIRLTGGVIGPLLAYEVLTAFFLEASFLGVMLFGWKKVGPRLHFLATLLVAIGTSVSAFWILSANSWMQTPQGYEILADGRFVATSFMEVIFNPSFPSRLTHMLLAAFLTTALVVGAASAFQVLKSRARGEVPTGWTASSMCVNREGKLGLKITSMKLVATKRPSGRISKPCGVCIQLLADRIQKAETLVPMATRRVARKCSFGPTFFQPNSMTPRNEASRKKAVSTS